MEKFSFIQILQYKYAACPEYKIINYKNRWYTWKEIYEYSVIMAEDLRKLGVKKGSHVGICVRTSINWIIAFFAVHIAGGIAVLLNDLFPDPELMRACKEADVEFLCANGRPGTQYDISDALDFTKQSYDFSVYQNAVIEKGTAEDKSIIIFTSGTTDKEKAIMLSLSTLVTPDSALCNFFEGHCFMASLPLFHILGFSNILVALFTKTSSLVLSPTFFPDEIFKLIVENNCDAMFSVPTMLLGIADSKLLTEQNCNVLKLSILGGSAVGRGQIQFLRQKFPECKIFTGYGMSETSVITMTSADDSDEIISTSIGKPIPHIILKIVKINTNEECQVGETGELLIKGKSLTACYYKNHDENSLYDEDGFIHSGDLACKDENGNFFITGRIKNLIIRGGENILPSELRDAILKYEDIKDAEVVAIPDSFYGEVAGAALITKDGCNFDENNLTEFLRTQLTVNKIPKYFVEFKKFPLLANGKSNLREIRRVMMEKYSLGD